jgi:hypothetical protein
VDGDKANNAIENLMLFATTGEHTKHHEDMRAENSVEEALEIIGRT